MSDVWYRDPHELPPYEDCFGRLWTLDGRCLNPPPPAGSSFLDEWPEDLQREAFQASLVMGLVDAYDDAVVAYWAPDATGSEP